MAVQTPVASVEVFLEALAKSGLLSAEGVAAARAAGATDPKLLARDLVKSGTLTRWQASQLLHGFHLLTIGKFKLLDQLGAGEIGRVYLAEHAQMGRRHTLKVLAKRHMSNPDVVKKFLAEATHACGLDHRNVSHVYDVSRDGDRCYVVMEYVEGEDLQQLVRRAGRQDAASALEVLRQAAEGLAHAHENGVVHGDLKPTNLLLDGEGLVKILDIGQSRLISAPRQAGTVEESQEMPTAALAGFQAPELRANPTQAAEVASDVYSLGAVGCYLLTGKAVTDADEAAKELKAAGAAPELIELLRRLMAADPASRPASMGAVLEELTVVARDAAKSPAPPVKTKKPPVAKSLDDAAPEFAPVIQTAPKKAKKPPVKATPLPEADAATNAPVEKPAASKTPLIIAGAIGGGVLVLGGIGVLIAIFAFGGSDKKIAQAPESKLPAAAEAKSGETNPAEANPTAPAPAEANPAVAEANPAIPAPAAPANPPPSSAPEIGSAAKVDKTETKPPSPEPMPEPPAATTPPPTETKPPESKPEPPPAKPKTAPAKTTPKAPAKAKVELSPFEGFPVTVALPALPEAMAQPAADTLAPLPLGPCKVPAEAAVVAHLKGGETAIRGGKQKFVLQAKSGTAPRDWEFQLAGGEAPAVVATLAAKDDKLVFQWTDEGVKQAAAARQLCNCVLSLTAGTGKHQVALRQPISGPSLAIEFEKAGSVKWTIDSLPDPKSIKIQVRRCDGLVKQKLEPEEAVTVGDDLTLWTGPADDAMFLGLKLKSKAMVRGVQIDAAPQIKAPGGKPESYNKRKMAGLRQSSEETVAGMTNQLALLNQQKGRAGVQAAQIADAKTQLTAQIAEAQKGMAALDKLLGYVTSVQGNARMQFRVFCQVEDVQVDLLVTDDGK